MARMTLDELDAVTSVRLSGHVRSNAALAQIKLETSWQIAWQPEYILAATESALVRNYGHAAALIRRDARESIIPDPLGKSAPAGRPVSTRKGQVKRAIVFAADKYGAVIGPTARLVGRSMSAHETGGRYKGTEFPARPTMVPAMMRQAPRFAGLFQGSIGT